jgi:UDP-N-acetylglucosamine 2-epimerase (non-hydrolysing)
MKLVVTVGTRPEIIRMYHTIKLLKDTFDLELYLLFTAQNFEVNLSTHILRDPMFGDTYKNLDWLNIGEKTSFVEQVGPITTGVYDYISQVGADKVLVLGDTNSALFTVLAAKKLGVPLYHMEAGNRCFNPASPEEINRKIIDSIADVHLCYTQYARQNLIREGVDLNRIHVIGNPISEFEELHKRYQKKNTIVATFHRQENENNITNIISALSYFKDSWEVIACLHPRYIDKVRGMEFKVIPSINFSDFIKLQGSAKVIVTDSGTVCEETTMLGVPSVIIRDTMERPELFDCGSTVLSGADNADNIINAIYAQLENFHPWDIPTEYRWQHVSGKVRNIIVGKGNYVITP